MLECPLWNIYAALFQQTVPQRELCEPLAQKHVLLELLENLPVKMVRVRKQPVQPAHYRIQILRLAYRYSTRVVLYVQQYRRRLIQVVHHVVYC